jgi:glycosyltransferase involved in cell wall biosynthesis
MIPEKRILITKFPFRSSLGGVEKHTFEIVENLGGKGIKFYLLSSCPVMLSEFRKRGLPAERWWLGLAPVNALSKTLFLLSSPLLIISGLVGLIMARVKYKVDTLYCLTLTEKLVLTPLAAVLGLKILWFEHLSIDPVISKNIYLFFYKAFSELATVVAVSDFVKEELTAIGVENAPVIHHGIDADKYLRQENLFGAMAQERSTEYGKKHFTVGYVGRLEKVKGIEYLIKAVDLLKEKIPEIDLVVVGEGSQKAELAWLAEQMGLRGKVKFVGYKDDYIGWLKDFGVFVLPSVKESLGIILLEAMACGCPVVAAKVGGVVEVVEHEKNGLLVEPKNPTAIADAVLRIYHDRALADRLKEAAAVKVKQNFSLVEMLSEYQKLLLQ